MSIDLKTVSTSLGITTKKAEASVDTLPLDIQAIEPISIWTTSSVGVRDLTEEIYKNTFIKTVYADNYQHPHVLTDSEISQKTAIFVNTSNNYEKGIHQDPISVPIHIKGNGTRDIIVKKSIPTSFITDNEVGTDAPAGTKHVFDSIFFNSINNATKTSHFIKTNLVPIHIKGYGSRSPIIQNLSKVNINTSGHTDTTAIDLLGTAGAFEITIANHENTVGEDGAGEAFFDTSGAHTWTAPAGITSVSVVAIGGGGGGGQSTGGEPGGGGGGLGWKNNISVTAGQTYNLNVGAAGVSSNTTGTDGGDSYFIDATTVKGGGGGGSTGSSGGTGGTYVGDGGGNGGNGAPQDGDGGGGGGAGGYSGAGGAGGPQETNGYDGSGGGGGGGSSSESSPYNGGGGVNPYGEGTSGVGGTVNTTSTNEFGKGGSGGEDGTNDGVYLGHGGKYGGGGGGSDSGYSADRSKGAVGCVRILWGTNRSFPSTSVSSGFAAGSSTTQVSNPIPVFVENPSHTYSRAETINSNFDKITFDTKLYKNYGSSYSINNLDPILTNNGVDDEFITQKFPPLQFNIKNNNFPVIGNSELPKQQFSKISFDTKLSKIYGSNYNTNNLNEISIKNGVDDEFITQKFPPLRFDIKNTVFDGPTSKTKIPTTQTTILTGFDKSSNSPTFCNSLQFNFRIKMGPIAEWGHFTKDGVGSFSILNRYNDPRLTSASSSSSSSSSEGDSESSGSGGTGPVQSWSS